MAIDYTNSRAQQLEQQRLLLQRRREQEDQQRLEEVNERREPLGLTDNNGGFMETIMKMLKGLLLAPMAMGGLFSSDNESKSGFFSNISSGFSDFTDGLSGRGDTPLAPRGSKPSHRSWGTAIAAPLRAGWDGVLDFIGRGESGGDYNIAYGSKKANFTNMTINEVQQWQRNYVNSGSPSSAVGKYQIIQNTLAGLKNQMGLSGNEKFDQKMQDQMAMQLLENRGIGKLEAGQMTTAKINAVVNSISKEWASIKGANGRGAYDGDGLNHANADITKTLIAAVNGQDTSRTSVASIAVPDKTASKAPDVNTAMTKVAVAAPAPAPQVVASVTTPTEEQSWVRKIVNGVKTFSYGEDPKDQKPAVIASTGPEKVIRNGLTLGLNS